jgi:hypothetical protein
LREKIFGIVLRFFSQCVHSDSTAHRDLSDDIRE